MSMFIMTEAANNLNFAGFFVLFFLLAKYGLILQAIMYDHSTRILKLYCFAQGIYKHLKMFLATHSR